MTRRFLREHAELRDNVEHFLVALATAATKAVSSAST